MIPEAVTSIAEPIADPTEVVIRRHQDFIDLFRLMKRRLNLTNEFIDAAGGLTAGHCDKILGPSQSRGFGPAIFDMFITMFALEFHAHVDLEAAQRMRGVWEMRKRPMYPKNHRISKELIARARPHVLQASAKAANAARNAILTREQKSKIARTAARARWRRRRNSTG